MDVKCAVCHRDSFYEIAGGQKHFCLKLSRWVIWRKGIFYIAKTGENPHNAKATFQQALT